MKRQNVHLMTGALVHIRFMGQSRDVPLADLGLAGDSPDSQVISELARFLEVQERSLAGYVIERHDNGNLTVRPEAMFGSPERGHRP